MRTSAVVTRTFLGALVAVPFLALAACSTVTGREFDDPSENENAAGATTERSDAGSSPAITADDAGKVEPKAPGSEIDLTTVTPCDADLPVDGDAEAFLKAIGLCKMAAEDSEEWGVIEAKFTKKLGSSTANNNDGQRGILPKFGDLITPREGGRLGVLSTGWAREYNSEDGTSGTFSDDSKSWDGFSLSSQNDIIVLALKIRVPLNAKSFSFDFNFHSGEWPVYVGSGFNDEFTAELDGENISFDSNNQKISVNTGFFDRCTPGTQLGDGETSVCSGGPEELNGTGFEPAGSSRTNGGATGWLTTKASVEPGSIIELQFGIWDVKDTAYDSLVLIDNFTWDADPVTTGTDRPVN